MSFEVVCYQEKNNNLAGDEVVKEPEISKVNARASPVPHENFIFDSFRQAFAENSSNRANIDDINDDLCKMIDCSTFNKLKI